MLNTSWCLVFFYIYKLFLNMYCPYYSLIKPDFKKFKLFHSSEFLFISLISLVTLFFWWKTLFWYFFTEIWIPPMHLFDHFSTAIIAFCTCLIRNSKHFPLYHKAPSSADNNHPIPLSISSNILFIIKENINMLPCGVPFSM